MNNQTENSNNDNVEPTLKRQKRQKYKGKGKGLFIVFIISISFVLILFVQYEPINTINCNSEIIASKPDVIMLGAWWCGYCHQAKRYFQQNNIHYCEYDMENTVTGRQLYQQHGAGAVPILIIGKYQLNGFSEKQVETALALLKDNTIISD